MSEYMNLLGQKAKKASLKKINTEIKNNVLRKYALLLIKKKIPYLKPMLKI